MKIRGIPMVGGGPAGNGKLGGPDVPDLEPLLDAMAAAPPDADP